MKISLKATNERKKQTIKITKKKSKKEFFNSAKQSQVF